MNKELSLTETTIPDRFKNIANNYGELFNEVFSEQGLDYQAFQNSVFQAVTQSLPDFRMLPILDIGIGDGETSRAFVEAGCKKIVGIDVNTDMLEAARQKLGTAITLLQMNAVKMEFVPGEFPIIITGEAIHNISKNDRKLFWQELLRLAPKIFVAAEKIADPNPVKHKAAYESEVAAIQKIYGEKYKLHTAEKEWLDHYAYDERERLELIEIKESIGQYYDIKVVAEMGMCKTVVARRK